MGIDSKRIKACANCGNLDIKPPTFQEGGIPGISEVAGVYYCEKCGKKTVPIFFDSEKDYRKFLKEIKKKKQV